MAAELAAARPLPQAAIDAMLKAGIPAHALAFDADGTLNVVHVAPVVFGFDDRFEFARHVRHSLKEEPCDALVWVMRDLDGRAADIVAWSAKRNRVATWLGALPMLGMEQAQWRPEDSGPLPVHRKPSSWFRAGRHGVIILDYWSAAPWLHHAPPLLVRTPIEGEVLRESLTIPAPKILVGEMTA